MWWIIGGLATPVALWCLYVGWRIYQLVRLSTGDDDEDFKPGKT